MRPLHWIALTLVIVGALNWGLVGLLHFDLVATLFGPGIVLSRMVYSMVGIAGATLALTSFSLYGAGHRRQLAAG